MSETTTRCHALSADGRSLCRFLAGHDGPHGEHIIANRAHLAPINESVRALSLDLFAALGVHGLPMNENALQAIVSVVWRHQMNEAALDESLSAAGRGATKFLKLADDTAAPFAAFIDAHYGCAENYESEPTSVVNAVRAAFLAGFRAALTPPHPTR